MLSKVPFLKDSKRLDPTPDLAHWDWFAPIVG